MKILKAPSMKRVTKVVTCCCSFFEFTALSPDESCMLEIAIPWPCPLHRKHVSAPCKTSRIKRKTINVPFLQACCVCTCKRISTVCAFPKDLITILLPRKIPRVCPPKTGMSLKCKNWICWNVGASFIVNHTPYESSQATLHASEKKWYIRVCTQQLFQAHQVPCSAQCPVYFYLSLLESRQIMPTTSYMAPKRFRLPLHLVPSAARGNDPWWSSEKFQSAVLHPRVLVCDQHPVTCITVKVKVNFIAPWGKLLS